MLLRVGLVALVVVHIWRPILLAIFHANPSLINRSSALSFTFASPIVAPVIFLTLLMVVVYEGPLRANLLTFNLGAVALLVGILTAIATQWLAVLVVDIAPGLDAILSSLGYRQYITNIFTFIFGMYTNALIYQFIRKKWPRRSVWFACLSSVIAGWIMTLLFAVLASRQLT